MQYSPHPPSLEAHVRAAWQKQVAAAVYTPGLLPELVRRHELPPHFAAYYTQLRALPRRVRRALQRQWRLPLAGVALMLALGQSPGLAATIPVGGACTLIDAITAANTDTTTGGCPAGSRADTIVLQEGSTQTLTEVNNSTYGATGLPVISSVITIVGQGSTIVRDSTALDFRILVVDSTGELTLQETTVSGGVASSFRPGGGVANYGGTLTVLNSIISGNSADCCGGGMANYGGTLTVTDSIITDNSAGGGGGVWNVSSGTCTVTDSTITDNSAEFGGGVINNGTLTMRDSTIMGNAASGNGGGVYNTAGGILTVLNSTIAGNTANFNGGGVSNIDTLTVLNSTISGNFAFSGNGGGIDNGGTCTVLNSTISGNFAFSGGGVAILFYNTLTVLNSTIVGNSASLGGGVANLSGGTLILARTLVAGNTAPIGPESVNSVPPGTVLANNHNLFGVDGTAGVVGFSPGATDIVPPAGVLLPDILDPMLAFNGGPTQTHALVPGSPAIDAAGPVCLDANGNPLPTDQRGTPRLVDGDGDGTAACDIGAVEFFPLVNDFVTLDPALETAFDPAPVPGGPAGTFTITATFTNTSDTPLRFPFFTVTDLSGGNLVLNAEEGTQGVGATVTLEAGDSVLAPGETVTVDFVIGLQAQAPFTLLVDLFGEPLL